MTPSESLLFMRWMSSGRLIGVENEPHAPWLGSALTPELAVRVVAQHNEWLVGEISSREDARVTPSFEKDCMDRMAILAARITDEDPDERAYAAKWLDILWAILSREEAP